MRSVRCRYKLWLVWPPLVDSAIPIFYDNVGTLRLVLWPNRHGIRTVYTSFMPKFGNIILWIYIYCCCIFRLFFDGQLDKVSLYQLIYSEFLILRISCALIEEFINSHIYTHKLIINWWESSRFILFWCHNGPFLRLKGTSFNIDSIAIHTIT